MTGVAYAGMCFDEPEEGDIEIRIETLETAMGLKYRGPMVYELDYVDVDDTHEKLAWQPVCPLVDVLDQRPDLYLRLSMQLKAKVDEANAKGQHLVAA